ncbi:MAG: MFS transporter [Candidatus Xenobia bacterium]
MGLLQLLAPPPDVEPVAEDEMVPRYRYWRVRQLYGSFTGYCVFYFVRANLPVAVPFLEDALKVSRSTLGAIMSAHGVVYGISKFVNGMVADRSNPRILMALGLLCSALCNMLFGASTALYVLALAWLLNGWFQGMGFPPCARILSHWFSPKERGRFWSIWNCSHQVGGALIALLAGFLAQTYGWRMAFLGPAFIGLAIALFVYNRLRDTPGSLGLPPVEEYTGERDVSHGRHETLGAEAFKRFLAQQVFRNPYVWLICIGNFFVYILRYGVYDWGADYLKHVQHLSGTAAGGLTGVFEIAGIFGSVLAGWLTDTLMKGRRAPMCVAYMLGAAALVLWFRSQTPSAGVNGMFFFWEGFLIYGPQFLVGVMTADLVTRQGAATAIGLTGTFGYFSQLVSGWGFGWVIDTYGWDRYFTLLVAFAVIGAIPFILCWNCMPANEEEVLKRVREGEPLQQAA